MTLSLGREANSTMHASVRGPTYAKGCKRGHEPLRFRGDSGACFRCGRFNPPAEQLSQGELAKLAGKRYAQKQRRPEDELTLDEAVAQTQLKLRALAVLEDIDVLDGETYVLWLEEHMERDETVDHRLGEYEEDEVRWAIKAAYV